MKERMLCAAALAGLLILVSGCQHLGEPELVLEAPPQPDRAAWLPEYAAQVSRLDADGLSKRLKATRQQFSSAADLESQCRYALVLGQWGHTSYNPGEAARLLAEAGEKMTTAGWNPADIRFAEFQAAQLKYLNARAGLLRGSRSENEQIRARLREAEEKLRAIADIERDLTENLATE